MLSTDNFLYFSFYFNEFDVKDHRTRWKIQSKCGKCSWFVFDRFDTHWIVSFLTFIRLIVLGSLAVNNPLRVANITITNYTKSSLSKLIKL